MNMADDTESTRRTASQKALRPEVRQKISSPSSSTAVAADAAIIRSKRKTNSASSGIRKQQMAPATTTKTRRTKVGNDIQPPVADASLASTSDEGIIHQHTTSSTSASNEVDNTTNNLSSAGYGSGMGGMNMNMMNK